jgi:hypothetical protein
MSIADNVPMRIPVEFIPRGEAEPLGDATTFCSVMPQASPFNIPDLMRQLLNHRAEQICATCRAHKLPAGTICHKSSLRPVIEQQAVMHFPMRN